MDDIDDNLLQQSTPLALTLNEAEQEYQPIFSFKFDAPSYRTLLIEVNNSLTSVGGYKMPEKSTK